MSVFFLCVCFFCLVVFVYFLYVCEVLYVCVCVCMCVFVCEVVLERKQCLYKCANSQNLQKAFSTSLYIFFMASNITYLFAHTTKLDFDVRHICSSLNHLMIILC